MRLKVGKGRRCRKVVQRGEVDELVEETPAFMANQDSKNSYRIMIC